MTRPIGDPTYDPEAYWSALVGRQASVIEVGQHLLGAYNRVAYRRRRSAFRRAVSYYPISSQTRVFEAAFGSGFYLDFWARQGITHLTGVDLSEGAVESAKSRFPEYRLSRHDITKPLALGNNFDVVTAIDVLYHIVDDHQWEAACQNLCALVKPGGLFIFTDKFPPNNPYQVFPHVRRRPLSWYSRLLKERGFQLKRILPVFILMDDPIPVGRPVWLAKGTFLQWRLVAKSIRTLSRWPRLQDGIGYALAGLQFPFDVLGTSLLSRSPNLEIVVAALPAETRGAAGAFADEGGISADT